LFFREVHGAEKKLISVGRRFLGVRRTRRFLRALNIFLSLRVSLARGTFFVTALRFVMARAARRWRLVPGRLDAAKGATKFVNLAFIGELLALGEFDEFEDFVKLVHGVLERLGDFSGVRHGLIDCGNIGGPEVGGFSPRFWARRFRAAFGPAVAGREFARLRGGRTSGFRFKCRFGGGRRFFNRRRFSFHWLFGMRLAKITGGVGFGLGGLAVNRGFPGGFRLRERGGNFFGGGGSFAGGGTRAAAAATAPATTASAGAARGGGQVQIGMFVRHKFLP
jgi:hypothetical protein